MNFSSDNNNGNVQLMYDIFFSGETRIAPLTGEEKILNIS